MANSNYYEVLQALQDLPQTGGMPQIQPMQQQFDPSSLMPSQAPGLDLGAIAPPAAPSAPIDRSIIDQYLALAGPAPVAPTPQPVSTLDRIAAALQGVQAGFQGRGGEFVAGLREQRERPQREFEQKQRDYEQRKLSLGLTGTQAAMSAEEKRQARVTGEADRQFDLDVKRRAQQLGFDNEIEIAKLRDAMESKRNREQAELQTQRDKDVFRRSILKDIGEKAAEFKKLGAGSFADEIARDSFRSSLGDLGEEVKPLSAGGQKALALVNAKIAKLTGGGSVGGGRGGADNQAGQLVVLSDGRALPYYKGIQDDIAKGAFGRDLEGKPNVFIKEIRRAGPPAPANPNEIRAELKGAVDAMRADQMNDFQIKSALRQKKVPENEIEFLLGTPQGPQAPKKAAAAPIRPSETFLR
jgi:hypothetical protein